MNEPLQAFDPATAEACAKICDEAAKYVAGTDDRAQLASRIGMMGAKIRALSSCRCAGLSPDPLDDELSHLFQLANDEGTAQIHDSAIRIYGLVKRLKENLHDANGVANLAIKHRDSAEAALAKCEECGHGPCETCLNTGYKYPDQAELALAAIELAKLPTDLYWLFAKGRTRPAEPLWAIQILNGSEVIAEAEGAHPADTVRLGAARLSLVGSPDR
jgi:hypothetical protein